MMNEVHQSETSATILVVDDVPANVGILVECLEGQGYRVLVAQDGEEGLQRAEFAHPDLILLDVMMSGQDGFEVCRRLKSHRETRDIPVIFMTALADVQNKLSGFEAGGVDYVTKPFEIAEVLARIRTHLSLRAMGWQLEERNQRLQLEVAERTNTENELRRALDELQTLGALQAQTQAQLLQSEKMAAIGQLAAGVAHEINNPIGFVISNMASLDRYVRDLMQLAELYEHASEPRQIEEFRARIDFDYLREDIFSLMSESNDGLQRVRMIVQNLRDFSHVGESEWQMADLHEGLDSTLNLVWNELKYKTTVTREYGELPDVECRPQEINQVFMNLLVNAGHAIEEQGTIVIRTGVEQDKDTVWVEVSDDGRGIHPDNLNRIFEPFFTTKPVGQGTGLGLSLSYGIVQKHGGRIEVSSEYGKGTTFRVCLPVKHPIEAVA